MSASIQRNSSLDVLRGVAIFLVLLNHFEPSTVPHLAELGGAAGAMYWRLRNLGWTGVDSFFVLSGFLISGLLFKEIETTGTLKPVRFWVRRAYKILPSYVVLLAVLAATGATTWLDATSWQTVGVSLAQHGLFLQNYLPENPNGPTWSLAVEEHFYLLLPTLLLLLSWGATKETLARRVRWLCGLALVGFLAARVGHAVTAGVALHDYSKSHFRFDSLFLGVLIQHLCRSRSAVIEAIVRRPWTALGVAAVLLVPGVFLARTSVPMFTVGYTSLAFGYGIVLVVFSRAFNSYQAPLWRGLATMGTWSYNIFLWNLFVLKLHVMGYEDAQSWCVATIPSTVLAMLAQFGVFATYSIVIGAALTKAVEMPFLRLRDRNREPREVAVRGVAVGG